MRRAVSRAVLAAFVVIVVSGADPAAAAPQGRIAYTAVSDDESQWLVRVVNADGRGARTVYSCPWSSCVLSMSYQAWDPTGRRVAVRQMTPKCPSSDTWSCGVTNPVTWLVIDVDRGSVQTLSPPGLALYFGSSISILAGLPFWSPDGRSFAFYGTHEDPHGNQSPDADAYVVGADGAGQRAIQPIDGWTSVQGWTPDGRVIFVTMDGTVRTVDPSTGIVRLWGPGLVGRFSLVTSPSPDGRFVALDRLELLDNRNLELFSLDAHPAPSTEGAWAPDSSEMAYIGAPLNFQPRCECPTGRRGIPVFARAPARGSAVRTVVADEQVYGFVSWSPPADPAVTIDTPVEGQEINGHESTPEAQDAVRLTGSVSSRTALSGWCFAVQAPSAPEPSAPTKAGCNRPFALTLSSNGRTTGEFEADLAALVGSDLKPGENTVWVWGYDASSDPGVAKVKVKVKANYYIRHLELAQAISPDLEPALPWDPLLYDPYEHHWSLPSVAGFKIPLVAGKRTLLRIYVGDSSLPRGGSGTATLAYRVTGTGLSTPVEGSQEVNTTTRGTPLDQGHRAGAINVWLSAGVARAGAARFHVELNPEEQEKECQGCFPNGNRADLVDVSFDRGGSVRLLPVDIVFAAGGTTAGPSPLYADIWRQMPPLLPIADHGLSVSASEPHRTITIDPRFIGAGRPLAAVGYPWAELVVATRLELFRLLQPEPPAGPGVARWVGLASPPDILAFSSSGVALPNDKGFALFSPDHLTAVHELGHTLGLPHALGFDRVPFGAVALPYLGIGGAGYNANRWEAVFDKNSYGDVMSYSNKTWTSPKSWQVMFDEILARSGGPAAQLARRSTTGGRPRAAAVDAAAKSSLRRRRLVSGAVAGGKALIIESVVADALAPDATGPVVAKLVGLDRRGRKVASAPIHGTPDVPRDEAPPFVAALPANRRIALLEVQPPRGGKPLARLKASRHRPKGRFVRLRRRASAKKALTVRWAASDRDRRDRLSVMLLARRGRGPWQTLTTGPARLKTTVDPKALGAGKRLSLRLLVSDGFTTSVVKARPIRLAGR